MIPRAHLISDARAPRGLIGSIERALSADLPEPIAVHLRHQSDDATLFRIGEQLRALTKERGALLFINRRLDLALALDADGLHLPEAGIDIESARRLFPSKTIGVSRHDEHGVVNRSVGADYAFLSPVGEVPGKAAPLGIERFSAIAERSPIPLIALGGVDRTVLKSLRARRAAHGFAAMRAVLHADDPREALLSLYRLLDESV